MALCYYLVTLITKAIDTKSNSYQPLWLRCWGETYPGFFFTKKLDSSSYCCDEYCVTKVCNYVLVYRTNTCRLLFLNVD